MDGYAQILKDNIEFCKLEREAGDAYAELSELMKEVLKDYGSWGKGVSREGFGKAVGESAMLTYLSFVLLPLSYGIAFDFLGGNLIASFMQMRALLEQLAKCYLADVEEHSEISRISRVGRTQALGEAIRQLGAHEAIGEARHRCL
jgi:hypothetical protein